MSSLYSTSLKTDYLDPVLDQVNRRLEFRLNPDTAYYSNLRLLNFGANVSAADTLINSTCGLYGLIKNILLFDGAVEIDRLTEANRYLAFRNLNNTNHDNFSLTQNIAKARVGYMIQANGKVSRGSQGEHDLNVKTTANDTPKSDCYLDLRKALPILENMPYLDTSLMPNLRVIIEYDTDQLKTIVVNNRLLTTKQNAILACDEILDPAVKNSLKNKFKGVAYNAIEHDVMVVEDKRGVSAALGAGTKTTQPVKQRINGFDNKVCGRLLLVKALTDGALNQNGTINLGFGTLISRANIGEKINFQLNGQQLLAGEGLNTPSKIMSFLHDTFGDCNIMTLCDRTAIGTDINGNIHHFIGIPDDGTATTDSDDVGQMSYVGIDMAGRRINQFQVDYQRDIVRDNGGGLLVESAGLDIHLFMEVQKQLVVSGNSYSIKYV